MHSVSQSKNIIVIGWVSLYSLLSSLWSNL